MPKRPPRILPIIILSQFTGTSLWFAGNAILGDIQQQYSLGDALLGYMTSAVQLGFIVGTLCFAFFAVSDRYSPRKVFFICSALGSFTNLFIYLTPGNIASLLTFRFITGFFLAGIYPVGMKIAAGWYRQGLGKAMGFLVGALVVGTAFPHLLKSTGNLLPWETVIIAISIISAAGGVLMLVLVPDGPFLAQNTRFNSKALQTIFKVKALRSAAFGYFGHMWELYTLWAFVPVLLTTYAGAQPAQAGNTSLWSFCIIAVGCTGCIGGGILSRKFGSAWVAFVQLALSATCCLISVLMFQAPPPVFLGFLLLWGITVVGDSPQFSTLVAQTAPKELVGSALTIVNSIGFFITIVSIQLINFLLNSVPPNYLFPILAIGPAFGLWAILPILKQNIDCRSVWPQQKSSGGRAVNGM